MSNIHCSRRTVLKFIGFIILVVVGDRMISQGIDRAMMATKFRYSQLYRGALPAEVVALGNSRGMHMLYRPAIAEVAQQRMANISFNALPTVMMPALWNDYLQHNRPPQRLLFEISCVSREDEAGALERFTAYMSHSPQICEVLAQHRPAEFWAAEFSHLYRFNSEFAVRSLFYTRHTDQDWIMGNTATKSQIDRMVGYGPEPILYSSQHVSAARQILESAAAAEVEVQLFVGPFHPRYLATIPDLPNWIQWLQQQLGHPITDYSNALTENEAFADHMHLNPHGARQLAELMYADGLL